MSHHDDDDWDIDLAWLFVDAAGEVSGWRVSLFLLTIAFGLLSYHYFS